MDWMKNQERYFDRFDAGLNFVGDFDAILRDPVELSVHVSPIVYESFILVHSCSDFRCAPQGSPIPRDVCTGHKGSTEQRLDGSSTCVQEVNILRLRLMKHLEAARGRIAGIEGRIGISVVIPYRIRQMYRSKECVGLFRILCS